MYTVADVMTRDVVALRPDDDLSLADTVFRLGRIRHLPVAEQGRLVGLVTHRDLLRAMASRPMSTRAADVMTRDVSTVTPDTPLQHAVHHMLHHKFGCFPVVDDSGRLLGIVTEADLVRFAGHLVEQLDRIEQVARKIDE